MGKRSDMPKIDKDKHHSFVHGHRFAGYGKPTPEYQVWSWVKQGRDFIWIKSRAEELWGG